MSVSPSPSFSSILFVCCSIFIILSHKFHTGIASASAQESRETKLQIGIGADEDENNNDILNYEPPLELQEKLPYFLSGMDKEGSPVWVFEFGRWDFRSLLEKGPEYEKLIEKYTEQMLKRMSESPVEFGADDFVIVVDLDGYDMRQFTSPLGLQQILIMARQFVRVHVRGTTQVKQVFAVNSNYLFQTVYGLTRPIIGHLGSVIELHGTNSRKWIPRLLKKIRKDQLPDWLGGSQNHQPMQIYG